MLRERWISMEAVDRHKNIFRSWQCDVGTDLFGIVLLSVTFGRTATSGRTITRAVKDADAANRLVRQLLRKRATAKQRLGVGYRITGSVGFEADTPTVSPVEEVPAVHEAGISTTKCLPAWNHTSQEERMCGRFSQGMSTDVLVKLFNATDKRYREPEPSWNVAPLQKATVVVLESQSQRRILTSMEWGLITPWEKVPDWTNFRPTIARCETVQESKPFSRAFRAQRCILPADAYYDWKMVGGRKEPYAIGRNDGMPLGLGAIWECWWRHGADRRFSLSIVTTSASEDVVPINTRMPLILEPKDWSVWLGEEKGNVPELLRPAALRRVRAWQIGKDVNNPDNNGPGILLAA
jgi:putative SOS response-associated peptidase YedK